MNHDISNHKINSCVGKVAHKTKAAAIMAKKSTPVQDRFLDVYRCKHCDKWHVGKNIKSNRSRKRVRKRGLSQRRQ